MSHHMGNVYFGTERDAVPERLKGFIFDKVLLEAIWDFRARVERTPWQAFVAWFRCAP